LTTLVLGGARSGKSAWALRLAQSRPGPLTMIATAEALDDDMAVRIARHRAERDARWRTIEEPLNLADALADCARDETVVIDCLTLWLSNLLHAGRDVDRETELFLRAVADRDAILVSNEVGLGLVPETPLGRAFRDHAGRLNQSAAAAAHRVVFIAAGLPLALKG
jgi:adenosylcobinamide kinase / adenosylcobinamide-phosphate guanylyltransferase